MSDDLFIFPSWLKVPKAGIFWGICLFASGSANPSKVQLLRALREVWFPDPSGDPSGDPKPSLGLRNQVDPWKLLDVTDIGSLVGSKRKHQSFPGDGGDGSDGADHQQGRSAPRSPATVLRLEV